MRQGSFLTLQQMSRGCCEKRGEGREDHSSLFGEEFHPNSKTKPVVVVLTEPLSIFQGKKTPDSDVHQQVVEKHNIRRTLHLTACQQQNRKRNQIEIW